MPYNGDEISWFFHIKFYEEFFLKRNFDRSVWETYEGYDHPQLSKYMYGGYVYFVRPTVFTERDQLEETYGRWQFYFDPRLGDISRSPFAEYIAIMREVNVVSTWITIVSIALLLYLVGIPPILCLISVLILLRNPLFVVTMLRATSDSHMMVFFMLGFVSWIAYIRSGHLCWIGAFAVFVGLSVSVKLTGIVLFFPFLAYETIMTAFAQQSIIKSIRTIMIVGITGFLIWFILNPTLYSSPIGNTWEYFSFRTKQSVVLQYFFPQSSLFTLRDRYRAIFCTIVRDCGESFQKGHITPWNSVNMLLILSGVITIATKAIQFHDKRYFYIALLFVGVITITGSYLPLDSDRYYLPMLVMVFLCFILGANSLIEVARKTPERFGGFTKDNRIRT